MTLQGPAARDQLASNRGVARSRFSQKFPNANVEGRCGAVRGDQITCDFVNLGNQSLLFIGRKDILQKAHLQTRLSGVGRREPQDRIGQAIRKGTFVRTEGNKRKRSKQDGKRSESHLEGWYVCKLCEGLFPVHRESSSLQAGALLAFGLVSAGVKNECAPSISTL